LPGCGLVEPEWMCLWRSFAPEVSLLSPGRNGAGYVWLAASVYVMKGVAQLVLATGLSGSMPTWCTA